MHNDYELAFALEYEDIAIIKARMECRIKAMGKMSAFNTPLNTSRTSQCNGRSPLFIAVVTSRVGSLAIVDWLVTEGADPNQRLEHNNDDIHCYTETPLLAAIYLGYRNIVKHLVERKDVNFEDEMRFKLIRAGLESPNMSEQLWEEDNVKILKHLVARFKVDPWTFVSDPIVPTVKPFLIHLFLSQTLSLRELKCYLEALKTVNYEVNFDSQRVYFPDGEETIWSLPLLAEFFYTGKNPEVLKYLLIDLRLDPLKKIEHGESAGTRPFDFFVKRVIAFNPTDHYADANHLLETLTILLEVPSVLPELFLIRNIKNVEASLLTYILRDVLYYRQLSFTTKDHMTYKVGAYYNHWLKITEILPVRSEYKILLLYPNSRLEQLKYDCLKLMLSKIHPTFSWSFKELQAHKLISDFQRTNHSLSEVIAADLPNQRAYKIMNVPGKGFILEIDLRFLDMSTLEALFKRKTLSPKMTQAESESLMTLSFLKKRSAARIDAKEREKSSEKVSCIEGEEPDRMNLN